MGFPLASTPVFNLVEFLVELQSHQRDNFFNHRQVLALLAHPYVVSADPGHAYRIRKSILEENQVSIHKDSLQEGPQLYKMIFAQSNDRDLLGYLRTVIKEVGSLESLTKLDKEYVFHALTLINRLEEVSGEDVRGETGDASDSEKIFQESLRSFTRLFRQLGRGEKIPFTGEPLAGLQVMGVLETRNLDFKNVFILSLNEGALPASGTKGSYIPHNIRRAYSLPTIDHQDAIYAYLFYRVIQRAENVFLFYNTETDVLGQGEMSRFLKQLLLEDGLKTRPTTEILHNTMKPHPVMPIEIKKSERVLQELARLNEGNSRFKGISPSGLNTYIECQLQFYLKHVARIREAKEVDEVLDARIFGNLLHEVMELFYKGIQERKKSNMIQSTDFDHVEAIVEKLIDQVKVC